MILNPGIYFEYAGAVKLERIRWKIRVVLKFPIDHAVSDVNISKIFDTCRDSIGPDCYSLIPTQHFKDQINSINTLREDLRALFSTPRSTLLKSGPSIRTIRGAPVELVGWATKKLFGVMDADDREEISQHLDLLFDRQSNLSSLVADQTKLVRSHLNQVHDLLDQHAKKIQILEKNLLLTLDKSNDLTQRKELKANITSWVIDYQQSLEHTLEIYKTLTEAVEYTSRGHLHPLLLTHQQLQDIISTVNKPENGHTTPVNHESITPERLFASSQTSIHFHRGHFIVTLTLPMTDPSIFNRFKIHSFPTRKENPNNTTSLFYIQPSIANILISGHVKSYMLAKDEYFRECSQYDGITICPPSLPLISDHEKAHCEFHLYKRPSIKIPSQCKIYLLQTDNENWIKLSMTDEWLISSTRPVELTVNCPGVPLTRATLNEPGRLAINGQCVGYTDHYTIHGVNEIKIEKSIVYEPNTSLDISLSHPTFHQLISGQSDHTREFHEWAQDQTTISLDTVERKLREFAAQRRTQFTSHAFLSGTFIINLVILLSLFWCCRGNSRSRRFKFLYPKEKREATHFDEPLKPRISGIKINQHGLQETSFTNMEENQPQISRVLYLSSPTLQPQTGSIRSLPIQGIDCS